MTATAYFVTGTDTEIGKTTVTAILLRQAAAEGKRAAGLKPIAAGVEASGANADVAALIAASNARYPATSSTPTASPNRSRRTSRRNMKESRSTSQPFAAP
jgi:dethiobiotin synthetase